MFGQMKISRRKFVRGVSAAVAGAIMLPKYSQALVKADGAVKIAVIGCGRSGLRLARNIKKASPNTRLIAVADVFEDAANGMLDILRGEFGSHPFLAVKRNTTFAGLNCLKEIIQTSPDILVCTTPPAFRPFEIEEAVDNNINLFMEKPVCVDAFHARKLLALSETITAKKLTAISGVQRRFHAGYREAVDRVRNGELGEILSADCIWNLPFFDGSEIKNPNNCAPDDLEYQLRNWLLFTWACGDHIVEQHVHNLDVMRWIFARDPEFVSAQGGRGTDMPMPEYGNRFTHFSTLFEYADGVNLHSYCRQENGTSHAVLERVVGTKATLETNLFSHQRITDRRGREIWRAPRVGEDPSLTEARELVESVLQGKAVNTLEEMTRSTMLAVAGRMSAYSGVRFRYKFLERKSAENLFDGRLEWGKKPVAPLPVPGKYRLS